MTTISDLRKKMMLSKKDNKELSLVLSLLLDKALKIAKEDKNREANDEDIINAAKTMMKQAEQSKSMGMNVDFEMNVLLEYLPQLLSFQETETIIKNIYLNIKEEKSKNVGYILGLLKKDYAHLKFDMKIASDITKKLLIK